MMNDSPTGTNEYRIEKLRQPVCVVLAGGTSIDGQIFLAVRARYRAGAEEPLDVLNDRAPFFPLQIHDGSTILVSKERVLLVESAVREAPDVLDATHVGMGVAVEFGDGAVCEGTLFAETSRERPRLLDFLNGYHDPFLAVYASDRMYLINRHQIAHVRALT